MREKGPRKTYDEESYNGRRKNKEKHGQLGRARMIYLHSPKDGASATLRL